MYSAYAFAHTNIGAGQLTQIVMTGDTGNTRSEYRSRSSSRLKFVEMIVAFFRRCLSFRQENSWEATKYWSSLCRGHQ